MSDVDSLFFRSIHYFAESHQHVTLTDHLSTSSDQLSKVEELLVEKLGRVAVDSQADHVIKVVSPFDLLPNEILSIILEHGYFESRICPPDSAFRTLATKVCRRFRDVTLQTPSLWSVINFSPGNIFDEVDSLPSYLEKSKSHPLEILLCCFWAPDLTDHVMRHLVPHSLRWRHLSIAAVNDYILNTLPHVSVPFLRSLAITFYSNQLRVALPSSIFQNDLPRLEHLSLRNVNFDTIDFSLRKLKSLDIRGYGIWPSFTRLNEMIGHSSLQYLKLHVKPAGVLSQVWTPVPGDVRRVDEQIHLPDLVCLVIYTSEWLTRDVANLSRLFACPKLQIFVMQEGVSASTEKAHTIVRYTDTRKQVLSQVAKETFAGGGDENEAHTQSVLNVKSASVYYAYRSLTYSGVSMLTTMELLNITFPPLAQMKEMFAGLKKLEHVSIFNLVARESLSSIMDTTPLDEVNWDDSVGTIDIPTLKKFVIAFHTCTSDPHIESSSGGGLREFLRLFNLPALSTLVMKNLTIDRWRTVVRVFAQGGVAKYPELRSLSLVDMKDILPIGPHDATFINPMSAFPRLERLGLKGVHTNAFLACLLYEKYPTDEGGNLELVWPGLGMLGIYDDSLTSRPLLHRVIAAREAFYRPLRRLHLDSHFANNAESLMWMKERVVVEIASSDSLVRAIREGY